MPAILPSNYPLDREPCVLQIPVTRDVDILKKRKQWLASVSRHSDGPLNHIVPKKAAHWNETDMPDAKAGREDRKLPANPLVHVFRKPNQVHLVYAQH